MPAPETLQPVYDLAVEQKALREAGLLGRGGDMGNALYAIDYAHLPPQGIRWIRRGGTASMSSRECRLACARSSGRRSRR